MNFIKRIYRNWKRLSQLKKEDKEKRRIAKSKEKRRIELLIEDFNRIESGTSKLSKFQKYKVKKEVFELIESGRIKLN